jgi:hypothetical protein
MTLFFQAVTLLPLRAALPEVWSGAMRFAMALKKLVFP